MRGTRLATPTIDVRVARLERRAESDDDTLQRILQILERMDQRLAALEADVSEFKADLDSIKVLVATTSATPDDSDERVRDEGYEEYRLLSLETSVDRRRPFAQGMSAG